METSINEDAINMLEKMIGNNNNRKDFSIGSIKMKILYDIENFQKMIDENNTYKSEYSIKEENVIDTKKKMECINKTIKKQERWRETLLREVEIIDQIINHLEIILDECKKQKGKEEVSIPEFEEMLLNDKEGFPYKDIALKIFKLGKENIKEKKEISSNQEKLSEMHDTEEINMNNNLEEKWKKLMNSINDSKDYIEKQKKLEEKNLEEKWKKLMNVINNSKDSIEVQRKDDNITFLKDEDDERG